MRVADKIIHNQIKSGLNKNRLDMVDLQNKAATQKRIDRPSVDPLGAAKVLSARTEEQGAVQFLKNLHQAKSFLNYSEESLSQLSNALVRAKELVLSQANDASSNSHTRQTTAAEIEQIFWQAVQIGNRKLGDRFIFGGEKTIKAPFDVNGYYKGDEGEIFIQVDKDSYVAMNIDGKKVFHGKNLTSDGIAKETRDISKTLEDLIASRQQDEIQKQELEQQKLREMNENNFDPDSRELASVKTSESLFTSGVNIFDVLKDLQISLKTNDKFSIQNCISKLDEAIAQVVLARSQLGSRVMALDNTLQGLEKLKIDSKITASQLEDADTFNLVSDLNKAETTLKTSLATSGRMVQPSLLDFLR